MSTMEKTFLYPQPEGNVYVTIRPAGEDYGGTYGYVRVHTGNPEEKENPYVRLHGGRKYSIDLTYKWLGERGWTPDFGRYGGYGFRNEAGKQPTTSSVRNKLRDITEKVLDEFSADAGPEWIVTSKLLRLEQKLDGANRNVARAVKERDNIQAEIEKVKR